MPISDLPQGVHSATVDNAVETFAQYDAAYWTLTSNLSDEKLPLFIRALTNHQPVSFKGKIFYIRRILLCEEKTIIVLKVK